VCTKAEYDLEYYWVMYVFWIDGIERMLKLCYEQLYVKLRVAKLAIKVKCKC